MEIEERLLKLHEHVEEHPTDYQSVVAELKLRSKYIEHERRQIEIERLQEVAEIRKRRKAYEEQRE